MQTSDKVDQPRISWFGSAQMWIPDYNTNHAKNERKRSLSVGGGIDNQDECADGQTSRIRSPRVVRSAPSQPNRWLWISWTLTACSCCRRISLMLRATPTMPSSARSIISCPASAASWLFTMFYTNTVSNSTTTTTTTITIFGFCLTGLLLCPATNRRGH